MKTTFPISIIISLLPLHAYDLHEWGTFTTVSGSDGTLLIGLEREEEPLPAYVHHHTGFNQLPTALGQITIYAKQMPLPVSNVKVKMETPVIYFHSDKAFSAKVNVGFNGGTIAQWYPERSGGEKFRQVSREAIIPQRILDFSKPYTGSIEWQVDVLSPTESQNTNLFNPHDLLQWTYARIPEANLVRSKNGQTEGFLFYRGLGSFDPGLITTVSDDETLHLENETGGAIPYTLVYERHPDGSSRWFESGALARETSTSISESAFRNRPAGFDTELFATLSKNLAAQGLLKSEADAMVKTWWRSYFDKPGLRVFWLLPQEKTETILPLSVEPSPEKTVRVIVGRSEVIRPKQEREWLQWASSNKEEETAKWNWLISYDRFGLAYTKRVQALQAQVGN
jgi:hypothetical protein